MAASSPECPAPAEGGKMKILNWNIAAINNNPFEYWITYNNDEYNTLMDGVQKFIMDPEDRDVTVGSIFTDGMFAGLKQKMLAQGWSGVEETEALWESDFKNRKIISGFMKDSLLGKKRLASMPDRVTNTINTASGQVHRPTAINCYQDTFESYEDWWAKWQTFMFDTQVTKDTKTGPKTTKVADMILPIKKAKYPAITEEEEKISVPLSTLCAAIFDSILIHMLNQLSPNKWQELRKEMCLALNLKKNDRTVEILRETYVGTEIMFLQEVANDFAKVVAKDDVLSSRYEMVVPVTSGKRDQNSVVLILKDAFSVESIKLVTKDIEKRFQENTPVAEGDLLAFTVNSKSNDQSYLLASFHGDTNGLATIPVVTAVDGYVNSDMKDNNVKMIFGLDANTYENGVKGKTQDVTEFASFFSSLGMNSCWGTNPDPKGYTTFNARTFLQPQLNKACTREQFFEKGDVNPKDFILFYDSEMKSSDTAKDNTGKKEYVENMVFPTLTFPSDHAVVTTSLETKIPSKC